MPPAIRKICSPDGVASETRSLAVMTTGSVAAGGVASWAPVAAGDAMPAIVLPTSKTIAMTGTIGLVKRRFRFIRFIMCA
jgi:hypothetical protein